MGKELLQKQPIAAANRPMTPGEELAIQHTENALEFLPAEERGNYVEKTLSIITDRCIDDIRRRKEQLEQSQAIYDRVIGVVNAASHGDQELRKN